MGPGNKDRFMCVQQKLVCEFFSVRILGLELLCHSDTFPYKLLQLNPPNLSCLIEAMKVGSNCTPIYARQITGHLSIQVVIVVS
jgi:hypothetical protein